ncbi:MAG: hypothetical protein IPN26_00040 [Bacteroidetes bacterium]|nr:hypothetical protein [Bacteroidota bacterium]
MPVSKLQKGINADAMAAFNSTKHSVSDEESLMQAYNQLGASVVEKISSSRKDLGYIALGEKITKQPYSQDEKIFKNDLKYCRHCHRECSEYY